MSRDDSPKFRVSKGYIVYHRDETCSCRNKSAFNMERPEPLSIRSPNRPTATLLLKKTIPTPSTIRKPTNTANPSLIRPQSPGKPPSPTRQRISRSTNDSTRTPKPRPISLIETKRARHGWLFVLMWYSPIY